MATPFSDELPIYSARTERAVLSLSIDAVVRFLGGTSRATRALALADEVRRSRHVGVGADHSELRTRSRRGGAGAGGSRAPAITRRRARRTSSRRRVQSSARADRRR